MNDSNEILANWLNYTYHSWRKAVFFIPKYLFLFHDDLCHSFNNVWNCNKGTKFVMILSRLCFCSHHVIRNSINSLTRWPLTTQQQLTTATQGQPKFLSNFALALSSDSWQDNRWNIHCTQYHHHLDVSAKKIIITSARYWKFQKRY